LDFRHLCRSFRQSFGMRGPAGKRCAGRAGRRVSCARVAGTRAGRAGRGRRDRRGRPRAGAAGRPRGVAQEHRGRRRGAAAAQRGAGAALGLEAIGVRHDRKLQGPDRAHSTKILPWSHTLFGNLKTWLRGTFLGDRLKHVQRYVGEFVYRFDRRWRKGELIGFVLNRVTSARPLSFHRLVAEAAA
jgi:hypothetical protein